MCVKGHSHRVPYLIVSFFVNIISFVLRLKHPISLSFKRHRLPLPLPTQLRVVLQELNSSKLQTEKKKWDVLLPLKRETQSNAQEYYFCPCGIWVCTGFRHGNQEEGLFRLYSLNRHCIPNLNLFISSTYFFPCYSQGVFSLSYCQMALL